VTDGRDGIGRPLSRPAFGNLPSEVCLLQSVQEPTAMSDIFSRRRFLRGAGAAVALPFLESAGARAFGAGPAAGPAPKAVAFAGVGSGLDGKPPLRLGIFTVTGGTVLESWKPKATGKLDKLPSILRPLDFAKDDLLVLSGLAQGGRSEGLNAHEHCALMHLTGAETVKKVNGRLVAGVSVDQAAASAVGDRTFLPSMEMGLQTHETKYSFRVPDAPIPYEANPRLVFDRMFRGRKPLAPNWRKRAAAAAEAVRATGKTDSPDRSVVDLVREEAADLAKALGRADRNRLDEYLDSVRSLEVRIEKAEIRQRLEALDAAEPGPSKVVVPTDLYRQEKNGASIWANTAVIHRDPERHAEYIRIMSDLWVLAFQTDTTRVATLAVGSDEAQFPGVVTVGYERHCHTLEHQGNASRPEEADPIAREACRQIHAWYTELFAEVVRKLKGIDEGGSSLLDNCLLLYTSYMADGGHGTRDYPVLLAGKACGTLRTGRHIAYKERTPVSNLYVEILDRLGAKSDGFGDSRTSKNQAYDGRLPGLV
jgi:hypothetical protein